MYVPASDLQRSIFFTSALHSGPDFYAMPMAWRVRGGRLDAQSLAAAGASLVLRHEALRTSFVQIDGQVWQRVGDPWAPAVDQMSFAGMDPESREAAVRQWLGELSAEPLSPERGQLFQLALADLGDEGQLLHMRTHHIVADGPSVGILLDDLDRAYRNRPMYPAAVQFRDVVRARAERSGSESSRSLDFWARALDGVPGDLGFTPPAPSQPHSSVTVEIGSDLGRWPAMAWDRWKVSWFTVLAAALVAALHRRTQRDTVSIGFPGAGRSDSRYTDVVGPCTTMIALCSRCGGSDTFADLVLAVRALLAEALDHDDVSYEAVLSKVQPRRAPGDTPFVEVTLFLSTLSGRRRLGPATLGYLPHVNLATGTMFTATMAVVDDDGQPAVVAAYRGDRIASDEARELARGFAFCLRQIMTAPEATVLSG
ncbi:MAG TPA: condensation domain-containing protein [Streptosporangiaceae bacterium]|nr:condensation domain-containing protein [Streptosporangiaceae bacterium]